jgi:tRNA A37 threonylcarbamoyladenosine dehydratase
MDARRSFYLNSRQSDFTDLSARSEITDTDIPYIIPANDNVPAKGWLLAICRTLFSQLIAVSDI